MDKQVRQDGFPAKSFIFLEQTIEYLLGRIGIALLCGISLLIFPASANFPYQEFNLLFTPVNIFIPTFARSQQ